MEHGKSLSMTLTWTKYSHTVLCFFVSHFFSCSIWFLCFWTRIHPRTFRFITIIGPAKWHLIPNCGWSDWVFSTLMRIIIMIIIHGIMRELLMLPNLRVQGETGLHLQKEGGVEAVGLTEEKEEEKVHFPNPKTCWLPPHQPDQTNPVTFKSFESWGWEEEEEEDEGEEEEEESKWQTWWQDLLKTWEKWSYDEERGGVGGVEALPWTSRNAARPSFHTVSKQNLLPLTVRRDVWGAAAIAVGSLGSFDVKVQQLHLQRNTNEMTVWWDFHSFGAGIKKCTLPVFLCIKLCVFKKPDSRWSGAHGGI